jgi:hypothetical protein
VLEEAAHEHHMHLWSDTSKACAAVSPVKPPAAKCTDPRLAGSSKLRGLELGTKYRGIVGLVELSLLLCLLHLLRRGLLGRVLGRLLLVGGIGLGDLLQQAAVVEKGKDIGETHDKDTEAG